MSYFHPRRMPELPARRRAAARRQLEDLVARSVTSGRRRRRVRHPAVIAAVMTAIVLGTGAAAAVVTFSPVTDHSSMRCYSAPRPAAGDYMTVARPGRLMTHAGISHAKSLCAALFREGFLRLGARVRPPPRPQVRHHVPPHLVLCVRNDGTASIVPGRGAKTCEQLGLKAAARQ